MDRSVFERLGGRFLSYADDPDAVHEEDVDAERVMEVAGKALQAAIVSGEVVLEEAPEWFVNPPTIIRDGTDENHVADGNRAANYHEYWCYAVLWIEEHIPDSGIVVPYELKYPETESGMPGVTGDFPQSAPPSAILSRSRGMWRGIARASSETCEFLDRMMQDCSRATDGIRKDPVGLRGPGNRLSDDVATPPAVEVAALSEAPRRAYFSYECARKSASLVDRFTDDMAYEWLKDHGCDEYPTGLPDLGTWKRNLRRARLVLGQQKNRTRAGRLGRSIIKRGQI